jgi:hypothetical protein
MAQLTHRLRLAALAAASVFAEPPAEARDYFKIDAECGFEIDTAWIDAYKPD